MKIYKESESRNIVDFYLEESPNDKKFKEFIKNGICKIHDEIFISDPFNLL